MTWGITLVTTAVLVLSWLWVEKSDFQNYNYHAEMRMYRAAEEQDWDKVLDEMDGKNISSREAVAFAFGFNRTRKEFRAGNDDMTSYFVLTCSEIPRTKGQEIKGSIQWTSGSSVKSSGNLVFKVEKYEDTGLVWLWDSTDKTGAVVKILN